MGIVSSLVFRPPRPASYTKDSLVPRLYFSTNRQNNQIPLAVSVPSLFDRRADRPLSFKPHTRWILFSHGNAEDLYNTTLWTQYVSDILSIVVVAYDYTGYGLSMHAEDAGDKALGVEEEKNRAQLMPSEAALNADAECALDFAEKELGLQIEYCVLWGRSLGCCAVCHLVAAVSAQSDTTETANTFAGVILQAPFTSALETVAGRHLEEPPKYDMFRNYDLIKRVGGYHCPCFVVHGLNDWIVNVWHGREMSDLALPHLQWPPLFPPCGHNDLESSCDSILKEVDEFLYFCFMRLDLH